EVVPVILRADDMNSMRYSVENRSPFLDRDLAEFAFTIPNDCLIRNGLPKWPLREATKGIAPDRVRLDDRKRGFNASIDSLVDRDDPLVRERLLSPGPVFDFVRRDAVEDFLDRDMTDNSFSKFLFSFISARAFLDAHADRSVNDGWANVRTRAVS
ncbi:MAG: asparagine synthase C-terminal domain-containing protein, partial [Rhodospirillales bacterium]|nr:asparagine synthase C-terminal domain-containing protein [Rhodospirillales bacterium]